MHNLSYAINTTMPANSQYPERDQPNLDSESDSEDSFHSLHDGDDKSVHPQPESLPSQTHSAQPTPIERFPPEEEAALLGESNSLKGSGNQLFGKGSYSSAIQTYDRALSSCPSYLDFELAVLRSNVAACHLKLEEWKEAVESADKGIESSERLEPLPRQKAKVAGDKEAGNRKEKDDIDIVEDVDNDLEERIERLQKSGRTLDEVRKLQVKLLTRRAKAKSEIGGWTSLQGADEDYRVLLAPLMLPCLSPADKRTIKEAAIRLGPRLNEAKEREMGEMMDKLKGLGNSILKPFGMSTENFKFIKDEKTGGYSMNFEQNPKK